MILGVGVALVACSMCGGGEAHGGISMRTGKCDKVERELWWRNQRVEMMGHRLGGVSHCKIAVLGSSGID